MVNVKIDLNFCKGCELCVFFCPKRLLSMDTESIGANGLSGVKITDMGACTGCSSCARMCPEAAISIEKFE